MLDFLHAANTIISNNDLKGVNVTLIFLCCLSTNSEGFLDPELAR